jgi:chemotaxis protein methyltransferase CheR
MRDAECAAFLQWCLPRLRMRWPGFRRVRSQVCKRIARRIGELRLTGFEDYRRLLEQQPAEWSRLDGMCRVTISRFYRDRAVFDLIRDPLLPSLAVAARGRPDRVLRAWSCGCASGEEPYTLAMMWSFDSRQRAPEVTFELVATDADPHLLERARRGVFPAASLRDLPAEWRQAAFRPTPDGQELDPSLRSMVGWLCQDCRETAPAGPFDLVLCRNLAFTYYESSLQLEVARRLAAVLRPGGALVLGAHERLPEAAAAFEPTPHRAVFRRCH